MSRSLLFATVFTLAFTQAGIAMASDQADQARARDIDKVNGGIDIAAGQVYGDLDTVNGGIAIASGARVQDAGTVNGGIRAGDDIQSRSLSTVNGDIRVGARARIDGTIETVNGGIFLARGGRVSGGIKTVNGAIGIIGSVLGGGIETVNGDITVGIGSQLTGGIRVDKPGKGWSGFRLGRPRIPRIVIGPDAVVAGSLVFEREVSLYVHTSARIGTVTGATVVRFDGPRPPMD